MSLFDRPRPHNEGSSVQRAPSVAVDPRRGDVTLDIPTTSKLAREAGIDLTRTFVAFETVGNDGDTNMYAYSHTTGALGREGAWGSTVREPGLPVQVRSVDGRSFVQLGAESWETTGQVQVVERREIENPALAGTSVDDRVQFAANDGYEEVRRRTQNDAPPTS